MERAQIAIWRLPSPDDVTGAFRPPEEVRGFLARLQLDVPTNSEFLPDRRGTSLAFEIGSKEYVPASSVAQPPRPTKSRVLVTSQPSFGLVYSGDDLARHSKELWRVTFIKLPPAYRGSIREYALALLRHICKELEVDKPQGLLVCYMIIVDHTLVVWHGWRSVADRDAFLGFPVRFFMKQDFGGPFRFTEYVDSLADHPTRFLYVADHPGLLLVTRS